MKISRRQFIKQMGLVGATGMLGFGNGLAFAQSVCQTRKKVLVVLHLTGGVDSVALMPPRQLQSYLDKYPTTKITNSLALNPSIGLHPAMSNLHAMYNGNFPGVGAVLFNQVGILNNMGQDTVHNRSHELAELQHATGLTSPSGSLTSGWLGRYATKHCYGNSAAYSMVNLHGLGSMLKAPGVFPMSAGGSIANMFYGDDILPASNIPGATNGSATEHIRRSINELNSANENLINEHQHLFKITHDKADSAIDVLKQVRDAYSAPVAGTYQSGNPLNQKFMDTVALINSWSTTKVSLVAMNQPGYDTHENQGSSAMVNGSYVGLAGNLFQLDQAIAGFFKDLRNRNLLQDVVLMVMSEFGRTRENGSKGTDHGTGGSCIVLGANVRREIGYCQYSNEKFTDPTRTWIKADIDIRSIYADILERHLGVDSIPIFPEAYVRSNIPIFV